ncbi:MAG: response regulator transcription factor [Chitinophagaceae bacterium]|nr:response regulator transcription factor [Chitinophagaceae bacterium]
MENAKLKISIIEDTAVIRKNLVLFINMQENMEVEIEASSMKDFYQKVESKIHFESNILLLDIGLPGQSGIDALPELRSRFPDMEIIIITIFEEEHIILRALCSGASCYVSKKAGLGEIVQAIEVVQAGGSYLSPSIAREIVNHLMGGRVSKATILSDRQKEILEKLSQGMSYKSISEELFLSVETIRTHVKKLYKVLQVHNKSEAIAQYIKGYIK